jgi:hypothetical protein
VSDFDARLNRIVRASHREGIFLALTALSAALAFAHCTHAQVWTATGTSIAMLGESHDACGHAMDAALDAHRVTPEQYRRWAAFSHYFRPAYDLARDRWLHGDDTAAEHSAAVLAALEAELAVYVAMSKGAAP